MKERTGIYHVPYYEQAHAWAQTMDNYHYAQLDRQIRERLTELGISIDQESDLYAWALAQALLVSAWKWQTWPIYRQLG